MSTLILPSAWAAEATPEPAAEPVTIVAGDDWIPLVADLDIEPGSALDFSTMGLQDPPAGRYGRVIAGSDGTFAFAQKPDTPQRFYGVNFCFGAHYLDREQADRLAVRLRRLGYNTVRLHHYERDLVRGQSKSVTPDPERLAELDYLMAALIREGIYITTDLFVSRPVPYRELGIDREGMVPMDTFKIMVPVHEAAWENWKEFSRTLLNHVNPHTGRRLADEPALAWLCMINEGNFGNFFDTLRDLPEWQQHWNAWLARKYPDRDQLKTAWGESLLDNEDPAAGNVTFPERLDRPGLRNRDCIAFLSETEQEMIARMRRFLREDLGCEALISNANSWTYFVTDQATRNTYDYVDDHFYVDHPQFLERSWRLPSRCPNTSPIAGGATGGRSKSFTRLHDKPFTITEYNYSGPGRYRGIGGILTGAMGALQDWDGIWRFAYSHSREAMFTPRPINYFDLAADPLSQAAERASLCLFLRRDLRPATHVAGIVMTRQDLANPANRIPRLAPGWHWLAWITRLGTLVVDEPGETPANSLLFPLAWQTSQADYPDGSVLPGNPYDVTDDALLKRLKARGVLGHQNSTDPTKKIYQSETQEITIDATRDILTLDTTRTAGGYAPANAGFRTLKGGFQAQILDTPATVWVSALDDQPISRSSRLLVTHLTDLQNTGIRYAERERKTLLEWGGLPHLVRAGRAECAIRLEHPDIYELWALAPNGQRLAKVPAQHDMDELHFTLNVAGNPEQGARMLYEIVRVQE